ncbi:putative CDP-alcohol phosphatidyltransferase class-I family [Hyphodiscus hymeniophilus]|uniref:CDP-alcohol phosphatidyltransferase class-I family n=1 Tax=Hyphodiscus hymeniophilus TaxID=353542 RepID=A0A9P7B0E5_9HELO|nr:putative CDP-alcohol phosphatidyltransferase class-I family [Hyphodiscus hymeniophilus]
MSQPQSISRSKSLPQLRKRRIAFAFDIDGVIHTKGNVHPNARGTIGYLQQRGIPFIFLTNAGLRTEQARAEYIKQMLGLELKTSQFVQVHTPFLDLLPAYADKTVLAIGYRGDHIRDLAHAQGFEHVITPADLTVAYRDHYPRYCHFGHVPISEADRHYARPLPQNPPELRIHAILVYCEPDDPAWANCAFLIIDLLLSRHGRPGTRSELNDTPALPNRGYLQDHPPALHFCNLDPLPTSRDPDSQKLKPGAKPAMVRAMVAANPSHVQKRPYLWSHLKPQHQDLSFQILVEETFSALTGGASTNTLGMGKPFEVTFSYAERRLRKLAHDHDLAMRASDPVSLPREPLQTVYMIGDTADTDILGANTFRSRHGIEWKSVLVETGVYRRGEVPDFPPTAVQRGVGEAVEWALTESGNLEEADLTI